MDAIDILMTEHRTIERALDALETWLGEMLEARAQDKAELLRFVSFIREFADTFHHKKEEDILFVVMAQNGFPLEQGPLAVMLHEHDEGRALVETLDELGRQSAPWTDADRQRVAAAASNFAMLLRRHIQKEDMILYPMARARLPEHAKRQIAHGFAEFERQSAASGEQDRLRRLSESLIVAYSVKAEAAADRSVGPNEKTERALRN